jgi:hypothetical protein
MARFKRSRKIVMPKGSTSMWAKRATLQLSNVVTRAESEPARSLALDASAHGVMAEFIRVATLTSITTSMLNARCEGRPLRIVSPLTDHFPVAPTLFLTTVSPVVELIKRCVALSLAEFYDELLVASDGLPLDQMSWGDEVLDAGIDWLAAKRNWQNLCGRARLQLINFCELDLITGREHIMRILDTEQIAKSAWSGGTPCIRSDNVVILPCWLNRRNERRIHLSLPTWIVTRDGKYRTILKDLSASGAGIEDCPGLRIGSEVSIEFPGSPDLSGAVIWSHGNSVGVKFSKRLSEDCPAIIKAISIDRSKSKTWTV